MATGGGTGTAGCAAGVVLVPAGSAGEGVGGAGGGTFVDDRLITRVNSPGPPGAGEAGAGRLVASFGSRLSVNGPVELGAAIEFTLEDPPTPAAPPPNIRVNSPGWFCDGAAGGSAGIIASDGAASGLRNNLVNSPGCFPSEASGAGPSGLSEAATTGPWGNVFSPVPWNSRVNSPGWVPAGFCSAIAGTGAAGAAWAPGF